MSKVSDKFVVKVDIVETVDNRTPDSRIPSSTSAPLCLIQLCMRRFHWSMHRRDLGECEKREGIIKL
jgi:hypothetical protein